MPTVFITSGTQWTVPSDWHSNNNSIECIGGGAAGDTVVNGGAGGAYSKIINFVSTPGTVISVQIGAGGGSSGAHGGDTWFNSVSTVLAPGGGSLTTQVGTVQYSGGAGTLSANNCGGGGGGAAGPNGNGGAGGPAISDFGASGGGGGGGGSAGLDGGIAGYGGNGGNNASGTGHGTGAVYMPDGPGSSGTNGGGGGGGSFNGANINGYAGGAGIEWDAAHGSGGGGGAANQDATSASYVGGAGGLYGGGGGGGGTANLIQGFGLGAQGIIVITYAQNPTGGPDIAMTGIFILP